MACKIITTFINPPIPSRNYDWCAYYEADEESGNYGWGATKPEAIENFLEIMSEKEPVDNCHICGDWHNIGDAPLSCQNGDGE